jgi:hypothetical protein
MGGDMGAINRIPANNHVLKIAGNRQLRVNPVKEESKDSDYKLQTAIDAHIDKVD